MLPLDCMNYMVKYIKDHKSIVYLFSTTTYYYSFLGKIRWNTKPIFVGNKTLNVSFYDNLEHIHLTKVACVRPPKNTRRITYSYHSNQQSNLSRFDIKTYYTNISQSELKVIINPGYDTDLVNELFRNSRVTKVQIGLTSYDKLFWPKNIHTLILIGNNLFLAKHYFPTALKKLKIKRKADNLRADGLLTLNCLEHLELEFADGYFDLKKLKFPTHLKTLIINHARLTPGCIPEGVEEIIYTEVLFNKLKPGVFPNSTKRISFRYGLIKSFSLGPAIHELLPPNLEYLYLGNTKKEDVDFNKLPKTLKEIYLETKYNSYCFIYSS
jgi:hypothetical protein